MWVLKVQLSEFINPNQSVHMPVDECVVCEEDQEHAVMSLWFMKY